MKLSTYGMWETPRITLVNNLVKNPGCDIDLVDKVLLEDVITKIIDTSYSYQQKLQLENSQLGLKERTLATYEVALATMLPSLAKSLNQPEELLRSSVETFIAESLAISNQHIDYLMQLATISRETKSKGIIKFYGEDFSNAYPILAKNLPFNDPQLIGKATIAVTEEIYKNCPVEILPMMEEHLRYMNEIAAQKMADPKFAEKFKSETGMTMEEYKDKKLFFHNKTSAYAYHPKIKLVNGDSRPRIVSRDSSNIPPEAKFVEKGEYSRYAFFSADCYGRPLKEISKIPPLEAASEKESMLTSGY